MPPNFTSFTAKMAAMKKQAGVALERAAAEIDGIGANTKGTDGEVMGPKSGF